MLQPPKPHNAADPFPMAPPLDPIASLRAALRGHYEIEREIGQGAFATVYLARDLKHERKVAVKVLHADPSSETGELRFIREIRLLARLQHPNILPLHDSGHIEALLYYVMPYVSGETLRDRINRERQLTPGVACNIARDIADALAYAHGQGIIHRDIKPENILLSAGHPVLVDFGIARVIDLAGVKQLTRTGMGSPGTPAYMSPEQLLGDKEIDGRSDTYSLGCVLFEMLTGKPPFTGKDGFVRRFTEPPPTVSSLRKDLPNRFDPIVSTALARSPNDRYQTANEFANALGASAAEHEPQPSRAPYAASRFPAAPGLTAALPGVVRDEPAVTQVPEEEDAITGEYPSPGASTHLIRGHKPAVTAAVVCLLIGAIAFAATVRPSRIRNLLSIGPPLDTSRFVVLPFASGNSPAESQLGSRISDQLYDAFTQWDGVPIVPDTRVAQAVRGISTPLTEDRALTLARSLGAGKLIWGQASRPTEPVGARVHLYDAVSGESKDFFVFLENTSDTRAYARAVLRLMGARARPSGADGGDELTHSYAAWTAYGRGHVALKEWDLPVAEREFRAALRADPAYLPAHLWLAQILVWTAGPNTNEWRAHAARATSDLSNLAPRDRFAAIALSAMASAQYPVACNAYSQLVERDSLDFLGWYGLGECQSSDNVVVADSKSVSGWSFRSSYHSAASAYLRALNVDPGVHSIFSSAKLEVLLPIASTVPRTGVSAAPIKTRFAAFPGLEPSDTVGFVPYPLKVFATIQWNSRMEAALRRNRDVLITFAMDWAKMSPSSAVAQEALANALEAAGDLGEGSAHASPVLRAIDSAIALSGDKRHIVRLHATRVRVLFKRGEFAGARMLADSLLGLGADAPGSGEDLAWVAALTGRADLAGRYWLSTVSTNAMSGGIPPPVGKSAGEFFAYAAVGICGAPLTNAMARLDSALRNYVDSDIRAAVGSDVSGRSSSMATPCTHGESALRIAAPGDWLQKAQQAFARNDQRKTKALLDESPAAVTSKRPGDTSPDYVFQEAWLRAQIGDTASATAELDSELDALPAFSSAAFSDAAGAASFARAMGLRSELAAKRGETPLARRWALALDALWFSADAPLRRIVDRTNFGAGVGRRP